MLPMKSSLFFLVKRPPGTLFVRLLIVLTYPEYTTHVCYFGGSFLEKKIKFKTNLKTVTVIVIEIAINVSVDHRFGQIF